jgi:hypothetical protein
MILKGLHVRTSIKRRDPELQSVVPINRTQLADSTVRCDMSTRNKALTSTHLST